MSNDKNAQQLLQWGLAQSSSTTSSNDIASISADIASGRRPDLSDPNLYDALMGKSEAQMMREELSLAVNPTAPLEDRLVALDNFEMLIEQIDNSNNITSMGMWPPLISLLHSEEPKVQTAAAWILGTAVQNNDKAQVAVLEYQPVEALLGLLGSQDQEVRGKAMYALSGLLKHNPQAMVQFDKETGWDVLKGGLRDMNISVRRKVAFLINALLFQDPNSFSSSPSTPTASTATAVAPVLTPPPNAPAAPLERGPATHLNPVQHPNVARALVSSGLLTTLISSLLPPGTEGVDELDLPPPSGADGDSDPRLDLDFAEKAATAVLTFTSKLPSNTDALDEHTKSLMKALLTELDGKPLDTSDGAKTRWEELGVDSEAFNGFRQKVQAW